MLKLMLSCHQVRKKKYAQHMQVRNHNMEGLAVAPKLYVVVDKIPVLSDGKTLATNEQLGAK